MGVGWVGVSVSMCVCGRGGVSSQNLKKIVQSLLTATYPLSQINKLYVCHFFFLFLLFLCFL